MAHDCHCPKEKRCEQRKNKVKMTKNAVLIALAWFSLALGFVGIFLPILPTTPFAILSAYLFSKSSPRLHQWLLKQPALGPVIIEWERHGVIRLRAKVLSTVMIVALFSYTLIFVKVAIFVKIIVSLIGICVLSFIWSRPSAPRT